MFDLKNLVFDSKLKNNNSHSVNFSKTWKGGGVFGTIYLNNEELDLEKLGNYLKESSMDLIMNSVEDDRIVLLENILNQQDKSCRSYFISEGQTYVSTSMKLIILMFLGENVYFGFKGKSGCYVSRNGKVLNLGNSIKDEEVRVISGNWLSDDLFLLSKKTNLSFSTDFYSNIEDATSDYSMFIGDAKKIIELEDFINNLDFEEEEFVVEETTSDIDELEIENEEDFVVDEPIQDSEDNEPLEVDDDGYSAEESFDEDDKYYDEELDDLEPEYLQSDYSEVENKSSLQEKLAGFTTVLTKNIFPKLKIFFGKVFKVFGFIGTWIFETIFGFGGRSKYKTESSQKLKIRRILLILGILVFGVGLYFSIRWIKDRNTEKETLLYYQNEYSEIESLFDDAQTKASYDSTEAKSILEDVISRSNSLSEVEVSDNDVIHFVEESYTIMDEIDSRVRVDPDFIVDLRIDYDNANLDDLIYHKGSLWTVDSGAGVLYRVSIEEKKVYTVFTKADGLRSPSLLQSWNDTLFVYDAEEGLFTVTVSEENDSNYVLSSITGINPSSLGDVEEFSVYTSDGSLYFLISSENKIMKSTPVGSGYSYPQSRATADYFASAEDIEITHVIYTLGDNNNFVRYEDNISIDSSLGELVDTSKFELIDYSYAVILDRTEERILVLKQPESGATIFKLKNQYSMPRKEDRFFKDLKEVTVGVNKDIYVLDGFRIIGFNINE